MGSICVLSEALDFVTYDHRKVWVGFLELLLHLEALFDHLPNAELTRLTALLLHICFADCEVGILCDFC